METLIDKVNLLGSVQRTDKHTKKVIYNGLHNEFYANEPKKKIIKIIKQKKKRAYSDNQCRKALELRAEGKGAKQIARETGIRQGSLTWCLKRIKKEIEILPVRG